MYLHGLWKIHVKTLTGIHITLTVNAYDKIASIKDRIQEKIGIRPEFQRLAGNGLELEDERTLSDYNIQPNQMLWLVYPRGDAPLDWEFIAMHAMHAMHGYN